MKSLAGQVEVEIDIPLLDLQAQRLRLRPLIDARIRNVLEHGQFIMGPEVLELEQALSGITSVGHAISCASGTDALLIMLKAAGIGAGDLVYVPAFTFAATAEAVILAGAKPMFVDVDPPTLTISADSLRDALTNRKSFSRAAVIAVDLYGQPADYDSLKALASEFDLKLFADAAQSLGAKWLDVPATSIPLASAVSFFPSKPLGCYGDGGAILTSDDELASVACSLRLHGKGDSKYHHVRVGFNSRLDTIQAAVLLAKITTFDEDLSARQRIAARYTDALSDLVTVPRAHPNSVSACVLYTIKVKNREMVMSALRNRGIASAVYYPKALHEQPAFEGFPRASSGLSNAEDAARTVLSLPLFPDMTIATQQRVIDGVREAIQV